MKTLVKYRAACHFESAGIAVRQGDELLCLGPSQPGPCRPHHARLYRCVLYRDESQHLFVEVYPGEAEEIVETLQEQRAMALSLEHQYAMAHASVLRWLSSDSQ